MGRHNEVSLYGLVIGDPVLTYNEVDTASPTRKLLRVVGTLMVIRGIRDFGAKDKRLRMDVPFIASSSPNMMKQMKDWTVGDMILVKGSLATMNGKKGFVCKNEACKRAYSVDTTVAFVNPIFMWKVKSGLTQDEAITEMRHRAEISNKITILGKVCTPPELFVTDKKQRIVNYQLDVSRKYKIKEDDENNKHDFPFVKSYGFIADNDLLAISKGNTVLVDGAIQVRKFPQKKICPYCNTESQYLETATEVVPYSTEYLDGCKSMDEVEAMKNAEIDKKAKEAESQI